MPFSASARAPTGRRSNAPTKASSSPIIRTAPAATRVRAAEINRAYRELRQARSAHDDTSEPWIAPDEVEAKPRSSRWIGAAFGLAAGAVLLVVVTTPVGGLVADFRNRATPLGAACPSAGAAPSDPVAGPLDGHCRPGGDHGRPEAWSRTGNEDGDGRGEPRLSRPPSPAAVTVQAGSVCGLRRCHCRPAEPRSASRRRTVRPGCGHRSGNGAAAACFPTIISPSTAPRPHSPRGGANPRAAGTASRPTLEQRWLGFARAGAGWNRLVAAPSGFCVLSDACHSTAPT